MRGPSDTTKLRRLTRDYNLTRQTVASLTYQVQGLKQQIAAVTTERDQWRQRFDTLLLALAQDVADRAAKKPGVFGAMKGEP